MGIFKELAFKDYHEDELRAFPETFIQASCYLTEIKQLTFSAEISHCQADVHAAQESTSPEV